MVVKSKLFPQSSPILKWTGGKRWLVPRLRQLLVELNVASDARLVDLFTGGLSVPLGLVDFFGDRVIANDLNPYPIDLYRRIESDSFDRYRGAYQNNADDFAAARIRFNQLNKLPPIDHELVELFYYLSKTSFNGLYRVSRQGNYNTPFGRYAHINYDRDLQEFGRTVKGWQFTSTDFAAVPTTANSVIYADPPYYGKGVFTGYCAVPFDWSEQVRLAQWLAAQPGIKIASNYPHPQILTLYGDLGFTLTGVETLSNISATVKGRGKRAEMLAFKAD